MQNTQMPHFTRTHIKTLADEKIGFGYVPDQIRKISQAEGFHINILITGRRGLGTYSLINSLFKLPLIDKNRDDDLNTYKNEIIENDISLRTSITTYHGNDIDLLMRHLETMNEEYFDVEQGLSKPTVDPRIHLCIYMVPDDKLRNDEIKMIKQLSMKCNFLPVIAKADTYTAEELLEYKAKIIEMMAGEEIKLFMPRIADDDEDEYVDEMRETIDKYPLAVIASTTTHERNNETFYGRLYPWGFIDIENEEVSDFLKLRKLIINNCLDELIFTTDSTFYNDYRKIHMETERVDVALRRNRLAKIRCEMEKILRSKNEKKLKKIMDDIENLEMKYRGKVNTGERDQKIGSALNSAQ